MNYKNRNKPMQYLLFIFSLMPVMVMAQQEGVDFKQHLTWAEIQAKAKAENKYIFIDCVTTWCGPCKEMSKHVFPLKEAGDFFNDRFVSVTVQMDRTDSDDEWVKKWYSDAEQIQNEYGIVAYPTFLYFSPDGQLVHRVVGGRDLSALIAESTDALHPETQYHTQLRLFERSSEKSTEGYRKLAIAAKNVFEGKIANAYAASYVERVHDLYTKEGLEFAGHFTSSSKDEHFELFLNESERVDGIMGKGFSARILEPILLQEEVYPIVPQQGVPNWSDMESKVALKYPAYAASTIAKFKIQYYTRFQDWDSVQVAIMDFLRQYEHHATADDFNRFAQIWYRLEQEEQAIEMQQKAIDLAEGAKKVSFEAALDNMIKGDQSRMP